ncbi:MAG: purine-nucleoside phosphorylase [Rhizomicrobium sp.]
MSENPSELIERAAAAVRAQLGESFPKTAIVLGSGLGRFADKLAHAKSMSYADIPGFSRSTVRGHHGSLMVGDIGGAPLAIMAGRIHAYEGHPAQVIAAPIRTLRKLGVERLVLTNASGGLKADMPAGTLMIVTDHINFSGINPLIGPNDESIGPRFPDMSNAYDPKLRAMLADAAREAGVAVRSGVYLYTLGPNFETPAEVRMFAALGADAVGMSTVPECLAARHCGMKVAALSLVTNLAAGLSTSPLSHEDTLAAAQKAYERVERLLLAFFAKCAAS